MYRNIKPLLIYALMLVSFVAGAVKHEPYTGSRIYWDINSRKTLFPSGNYARIIPLNDGRLMAVAEAGGGISAAYSSNKGEKWSDPELIIRSASKLPYAVPDVIQLSNGDIVVGFNPRPSSPYTDDRRFGIRAIRSTDNGKTWSNSIFIYDAQMSFADGCWEPCFLELPSGELHCYFANENPFQSSNEQEISMCRSFDGGLTWGEAVRICFRGGSRDGMPVPILTENNEIVVIVEDNGWPGYGGFRATTVRCPLEENWTNWVAAGSDRRNMIFANAYDKGFHSAAPYLRKLGTEETIASWQGDHDRKGVVMEQMDMFVAVGDADARNFKAVSQPFGLEKTQHALWNSVTALDDGTIFALGSIGDPTHGNAINVMTGYAMKGFVSAFGTPVVDGAFTNEEWTKKHAQQIFLGSGATRNRTTMDFLYDNENLYFFARVMDRTIFTDKIDNDGIFLYLDLENACDTYPQKGMFRVFMNADGSLSFAAGNENKWHEVENPEGVQFVANLKKNYYDMEIAISWKTLGYTTPPVGQKMRCNIEVRDRREDKLLIETIPETITRQSWSWPEFELLPSEHVGSVVVPEEATGKARFTLNNGIIHIEANKAIGTITLYDLQGTVITTAIGSGNNQSLALPNLPVIVLMKISYQDGTWETIKIKTS